MRKNPTTRRLRDKKRRKPQPNHYERKRVAGLIYFCVRDDGAVLGYVENSFSMGFHEHHVRFFPHAQWRKNKNSQKQLNDLKKRNPGHSWFMFRAGSSKCPLVLNWAEYFSKLRSGTLDKFAGRNLRFSVNCDRLEALLSRHFSLR